MISKIILITVLFIGSNCMYLPHEHSRQTEYLKNFDFEQPIESIHPIYIRERRQVHGVASTSSDGSSSIMAKIPITGNDKNTLSAIGSIQGVKPDGGFGAISGGLALDNVNGNGLSLTGKHIPAFGNQLTAAGKLNLLDTEKHNINANAFATRNLPSNPMIPNFNTYGGGVDYTYNQKIGASLGMSHTPFLQKTDYSAMGNLNLFRNPTSSLDFSAGAMKSVSPFISNRSWQPSFGLTYSKYF